MVGPTSPDEPGYGRYATNADGKLIARYTAVDPAEQTFRCTCGKPECPRARLRTFREHIAELYRVLARRQYEGHCFAHLDEWDAVLYSLRLAASIDDVVADTGYVEDPMVFALCETANDYENAHSEVASKYVAAASIFNFLWAAYEAAVELTAPNELKRLLREERLGERGRRLFEARPDLNKEFGGLKDLTRLAEAYCQNGGLFDTRLDRIRAKYTDRGFVFAAELCREFRNFLFHGEDRVPAHEHWHYGKLGEATAGIRRFYAVSRLLLYLIQALALESLGDDHEPIEHGYDDFDEVAYKDPKELLRTLQFVRA